MKDLSDPVSEQNVIRIVFVIIDYPIQADSNFMVCKSCSKFNSSTTLLNLDVYYSEIMNCVVKLLAFFKDLTLCKCPSGCEAECIDFYANQVYWNWIVTNDNLKPMNMWYDVTAPDVTRFCDELEAYRERKKCSCSEVSMTINPEFSVEIVPDFDLYKISQCVNYATTNCLWESLVPLSPLKVRSKKQPNLKLLRSNLILLIGVLPSSSSFLDALFPCKVAESMVDKILEYLIIGRKRTSEIISNVRNASNLTRKFRKLLSAKRISISWLNISAGELWNKMFLTTKSDYNEIFQSAFKLVNGIFADLPCFFQCNNLQLSLIETLYTIVPVFPKKHSKLVRVQVLVTCITSELDLFEIDQSFVLFCEGYLENQTQDSFNTNSLIPFESLKLYSDFDRDISKAFIDLMCSCSRGQFSWIPKTFYGFLHISFPNEITKKLHSYSEYYYGLLFDCVSSTTNIVLVHAFSDTRLYFVKLIFNESQQAVFKKCIRYDTFDNLENLKAFVSNSLQTFFFSTSKTSFDSTETKHLFFSKMFRPPVATYSRLMEICQRIPKPDYSYLQGSSLKVPDDIDDIWKKYPISTEIIKVQSEPVTLAEKFDVLDKKTVLTSNDVTAFITKGFEETLNQGTFHIEYIKLLQDRLMRYANEHNGLMSLIRLVKQKIFKRAIDFNNIFNLKIYTDEQLIAGIQFQLAIVVFVGCKMDTVDYDYAWEIANLIRWTHVNLSNFKYSCLFSSPLFVEFAQTSPKFIEALKNELSFDVSDAYFEEVTPIKRLLNKDVRKEEPKPSAEIKRSKGVISLEEIDEKMRENLNTYKQYMKRTSMSYNVSRDAKFIRYKPVDDERHRVPETPDKLMGTRSILNIAELVPGADFFVPETPDKAIQNSPESEGTCECELYSHAISKQSGEKSDSGFEGPHRPDCGRIRKLRERLRQLERERYLSISESAYEAAKLLYTRELNLLTSKQNIRRRLFPDPPSVKLKKKDSDEENNENIF